MQYWRLGCVCVCVCVLIFSTRQGWTRRGHRKGRSYGWNCTLKFRNKLKLLIGLLLQIHIKSTWRVSPFKNRNPLYSAWQLLEWIMDKLWDDTFQSYWDYLWQATVGMISNISQWFPTRFPEAHQLCKFYVSLIRPMYFCSWSLYKQAELFRMCLIRKNLIMCSVGVPPGTGLETGIRDNSVFFLFVFFSCCCCCLFFL